MRSSILWVQARVDNLAPRRIGGTVGLAVILVLSYSAQGQEAPSWIEPFQRAQSQLQRGNLSLARQGFEELWRSYPRDFALANAIGSALDASGRHHEATDWYLRSLRVNPKFASAYNNLALNYATLGDLQRAMPTLQRAIEFDPQNARAFYNLGLVDLQLRHFEKAAQAFSRAHELKPSDPESLARLAYATIRSGKPREGLRAIDSLLELPDDRKQDAVLAVQVLNESGLYKEALMEAHKAEETGAISERLLYEEASASFQLTDYRDTLATLRRAGSSTGSSLDYYLLLGSAEALTGDLPGGVKTLQTAVRVAPGHPEPYYRLSLVFLEGYRDQDARDVLSTGLKALPDSPLLLFALGVVNELSGREHEAVEDLQKSLAAKPRQPEAWTLLGDLYVRLGWLDQAREAYREAMRLEHLPETRVKYADLLFRLQQYSQAEKLLRKLVQENSRISQAYVSLGKVLNAENEYKQAETSLRRGIELDPDNPQAHLFLAEALQHLGQPENAKRERALASKKKERGRGSTRLLRRVLVPTGNENLGLRSSLTQPVQCLFSTYTISVRRKAPLRRRAGS